LNRQDHQERQEMKSIAAGFSGKRLESTYPKSAETQSFCRQIILSSDRPLIFDDRMIQRQNDGPRLEPEGANNLTPSSETCRLRKNTSILRNGKRVGRNEVGTLIFTNPLQRKLASISVPHVLLFPP
jgi:hypothetical protein